MTIRPATRRGGKQIIPNLVGQRFGRLLAGHSVRKSNHWYVSCKCDCGNEKLIRHDHLKSGASSSCGCYSKAATVVRNTKHGDCRRLSSHAPEFDAWSRMNDRCLNQNNKAYHRYGGRGIKVCREWQDSYPAFLANVGRRPSSNHSLERINNDGNYEPGNVRWATKVEQCNNRRTNYFIEFQGRRQTLSQWGREFNIGFSTLRARLERGWSAEKSLTTPTL